ncbi:MAG: MFS transporter [Gammaproteobacteria bacterium]|nr:MFS transporter [Gammaproteobacteria bacterium]MCY4227749.1 MFS transporter [Gammaproteobacteria bacterium]
MGTVARSLDLKNLVPACAGITVFGLAFGMTFPLLSLILESRGVPETMIGLNAAMMPIGILLFSPLIPVISGRLGSRNMAVIAAFLNALVMLMYYMFDSIEAWFVLRFIQGVMISTLFVLSEVWIVRYAGDKHRGKVVAIYGSILALSFGAGPALISRIGIEGWIPFAAGAIVLLAGVFPLLMIKNEKAEQKQEQSISGIIRFSRMAPLLIACVLVFSLFDAATLSLLPVYGIRYGLDISTSALVLTAMIFGNTVFQFPIGWLVDKFPHRFILTGCAGLAAVMLMILPFTMTTVLMWPVLVLVGTFGYGVYTVSLAMLGSRFEGADLVNGASAFASFWGAGALIGAMSGGWSMIHFGPDGLPFHLALAYGLLAIGLCYRSYSLMRSAQ